MLAGLRSELWFEVFLQNSLKVNLKTREIKAEGAVQVEVGVRGGLETQPWSSLPIPPPVATLTMLCDLSGGSQYLVGKPLCQCLQIRVPRTCAVTSPFVVTSWERNWRRGTALPSIGLPFEACM